MEVEPIISCNTCGPSNTCGLPSKYTVEELRQRLTEDQFNITQDKGTERPFTGKYYTFEGVGNYNCIVCGEHLFDSETKYLSGTGWPSFYDARPNTVDEVPDNSLEERPRTEITCRKCGSHLGHVFKDGPQPTGLRYCVNSIAIDFEPKKDQ